MTISRNNLYIESDNLWKVEGLTDKTTGSYISTATVKATVCEDVARALAAAISDAGGGDVNLQITAHLMITGDHVRIVGSINYDGEYTVTYVDVDNIKITATYVAEAVYNTTDVFVVMANGYQIAITYVAASDGDYRGTLPDTLHLLEEAWYRVFTEVNASGTILLMQDRLQARYF